jgi:multidrug resistance efflux pump
MRLRKPILTTAIVVVLAGLGVFVYTKVSGKSTLHAKDESNRGNGDGRAVVRTVHPRLDPHFRIRNQQIATVEPFYQAGLRARAAGVVRSVTKEIGEPVRMGESLIEIDAPDLEQDLEQKEAVILQRQAEVRMSQALVKHAEAAVESGKAAVAQRIAESKQAVATRDYKASYLARVKGLLADRSVPGETVYEAEKDYLAADAAVEASQVAVQRARADQLEKEASREAARTDIDLKSALVDVAKKDRDKAAAAAGFARITAPFDGVVIRRNIDPGMFVQNATTGASEPLLTIARTDLVTVTMKLPDVAAPFVSRDTDVEVTIDDLPGLTIRGKVTRFSPAIEEGDRKMRIEMDIFNGSPADFQALNVRHQAEVIAALARGSVTGISSAILAAERHWQLLHKGVTEGPPVCFEVGPTSSCRNLVPGMSGNMRLYLDKVAAAHLLPSSAVYTQGGKTYILVVRDGITRQIPVRVQVSDGRMVKVAPLQGSSETEVQELTGAEEVVISRQLEVGDGAKVRTVVADW